MSPSNEKHLALPVFFFFLLTESASTPQLEEAIIQLIYLVSGILRVHILSPSQVQSANHLYMYICFFFLIFTWVRSIANLRITTVVVTS